MKEFQGSIMPAKNLVKTIASDSETNLSHRKNCRLVGFSIPYKRWKPNKLSKSTDELNVGGDGMVLPSIGKTGKQRIVTMNSQEDLWKSIKSNYTFLMDNGLINKCQETMEELNSGVSLISSDYHLTCTEFIERFNALHDDLHLLLSTASGQNKRAISLIKSHTELQSQLTEYDFLRKQASVLELRYPDMKEDIRRRCNILNNKWKALHLVLWHRRHSHRDAALRNLSMQMKTVRKWLREVGDKLRSMKVGNEFSTEEITEAYSQQKMLQREIEARGKEVTSLVKQSSSADGATVARIKRLRRAAANVESTYHNVWIRSLETQCYTEQLLKQREEGKTNAQVLRETSDSELDEGPLTKHRRLSLDHWAASVMNRSSGRTPLLDVRHQSPKPDRRSANSDVTSKSPSRDVGILCTNNGPVRVSDKGVMVGTTGIAALKAEYGDDFSKLEIIQDVGYSSESSTHLSGDDGFFSYYSYDPNKSEPRTMIGVTLSLRDEIDNAILVSSILQDCHQTEGGNLNDSGFVGADTESALGPVGEVDPSAESDYLEAVLDNACINFKDQVGYELDLVQNETEIEEPVDTFHNRSSFTTSAQAFYKMISVDSDVGEHDPVLIDNSDNLNLIQLKDLPEPEPDRILAAVQHNPSPFDEECGLDPSSEWASKSPLFCSTPIRPFCPQQSVKRKRHLPGSPAEYPSSPSDKGTIGHRSNRVSAWLKHRDNSWDDPLGLDQHPWRRDSAPSSSLFPSSPFSSSRRSDDDEDSSSCDASCEYTSSHSSSSDECCFSMDLSSEEPAKYHLLDSVCHRSSKSIGIVSGCNNRRSMHRASDSDEILLPPPLSPPRCRRPGNDAVVSRAFSDSGDCCAPSDVGKGLDNLTHESFSDGDIVRGSAFRSSKDTISKITNHDHLSHNLSTQNRMAFSLPCILRHHSNQNCVTDLKSASFKQEHPSADSSPHHSNNRNLNASSSAHSCSETSKKKRRTRKKSCSSSGLSIRSKNGSATELRGSGIRRRQSARLLIPEAVPGSSRRRHFSQSQTDNPGFDMKDDGQREETDAIMLCGDNRNGCHLVNQMQALSPESDVVLTQLEVQSTVSDQVWDGYQDLPYLSEAYSETAVDEDAIRKLTDFGDDYCSAIGQPSRLDPPDGNNNMGDNVGLARPKKQQKSVNSLPLSTLKRSRQPLDSDSDYEDLHHVMAEARKALKFAKSTLERRQNQNHLSSAEYAELLSTCETHLQWLQPIHEHIKEDSAESNFSDSDLEELSELIQEWELLQKCTIMYVKAEDHVQQKYLKAQQGINTLFDKMSQLSTYMHIDTRQFSSCDDVKKSITKSQTSLSTLQDTKEELLAVNLQVHRFVTEHGEELNYKDCSLKDEVTELYKQWDDLYQRNGLQLTELQELQNRIESYKIKIQKLGSKYKDNLQLKDVSNCDNICLMPEDNKQDSLEKDLKELRYDTEYLETHLKGGTLWKTLESGQSDIKELFSNHDLDEQFCLRKRRNRPLITSQSISHPSSSVATEDNADETLKDAIKGANDDKSQQLPSTIDKPTTKSNTNRFWRILRVAIPIQFALVLLYCLACYLEPNCCEALNNFNFSLSPQFRYTRGPPPV